MYLEISSRQSGKTSRLIKAVEDHIRRGGNAIVVTHNNSTAFNLRRLFQTCQIWPPDYENLEILGASMVPKYIEGMRGQAIKENTRWFYDEFDMLEKPGYFHLGKNGYYVGTPMKLRTQLNIIDFHLNKTFDVLLILMNETRGQYVAHNSYMNLIGGCYITDINYLDDYNMRGEYSGQIFK